MPFSSIVGHHKVVDLLRRAVASGRVPQSLLLAGPDGVGKHAIATALAQAVNCPASRTTAAGMDACGTCQTCVRISRRQHFDVVALDRGDAASIKIDALRERVLDVVGYRPFEARRRVFIIDPADALTEQAQDALLKTLEEPPAAVMLILVTAFPDTLHATVLSRCRRLRCGPLSEGDVRRVLVGPCRIAADRAADLARASWGSVSRALSLDAEAVRDDRERVMGLLAAVTAGRGIGPRIKAAGELAHYEPKRQRAGETLSSRLALLASLLRDAAAARVGDLTQIAHGDLVADVRRMAADFDEHRLIAAWAVLDQAQSALDRNASPKIVADWVALTI